MATQPATQPEMQPEMQGAPAAVEDRAEAVFDHVRAFLAEHRLSPDPLHYSFAHKVVTNPQGALAASVRTLSEGGIRLSAHDIAILGGRIGTLSVVAPEGPVLEGPVPEAEHAPAPPHPVNPANLADPGTLARAEGLVAQTQMQVEGFTDMMRRVHAETQDFGRNLAASADAMRTADPGAVVRLTTVMLERVRSAEARLAAATHEASELRAKLEAARDDARRDPLTDLPNRRAFEEAFAEATAQGRGSCLAVCDVDRFKHVNDRFGHAVGDRVLKAIADALSAACAGQLVSRYGGEEFTILFAGCDLHAARTMLDAAREAVAAKRYRLRESHVPLGAVTFSAGLAETAPGEPFATVFGRADRLMYAAKDAGRNCVLPA